MMDVGKSLKERNALALVNPMTDFEPAKLAGIPGKGIIQVIRSMDNEVLELIGTWRLEEDGAHATDRLNRAHEAKESVSYQGRFNDPLHQNDGTVTVDVRIVAVRSYQYLEQYAQKDREANKTIRTLYRLEPLGSLGHADQAIRAAE